MTRNPVAKRYSLHIHHTVLKYILLTYIKIYIGHTSVLSWQIGSSVMAILFSLVSVFHDGNLFNPWSHSIIFKQKREYNIWCSQCITFLPEKICILLLFLLFFAVKFLICRDYFLFCRKVLNLP